jgi:hypothetical protein
VPTTVETPTAAAAASLVTPVAISRQNSRSISLRCEGAPGDFIGDRPVNSVIQPAGLPIDTSMIEVLRRPIEFALNAPVRMMDESFEVVAAREDSHLECVDREITAQGV